MKTMTKAEFIAMVESELPDDALLVGYSSMGGEFFELDEAGDVFSPVSNYFDEDTPQDEYVPEEATHVFEVV